LTVAYRHKFNESYIDIVFCCKMTKIYDFIIIEVFYKDGVYLYRKKPSSCATFIPLIILDRLKPPVISWYLSGLRESILTLILFNPAFLSSLACIERSEPFVVRVISSMEVCFSNIFDKLGDAFSYKGLTACNSYFLDPNLIKNLK